MTARPRPEPTLLYPLTGEDLELLELAVSWAVIGQRPAGEYGQLHQALIALRRRLREFHADHNASVEAWELARSRGTLG